jgi:hypothetical protein
MRNRFDELIEDLTIPNLHGISALGPHLSFYTYSKEENNILSPLILRDPNRVDAPAARGDTELMSAYGVANRVKQMVVDHLRQA